MRDWLIEDLGCSLEIRDGDGNAERSSADAGLRSAIGYIIVITATVLIG